MITIPFTRGGMPFEATISAQTCTVKDLTADARFALPYKFEITDINIKVGENASVTVKFRTGLETHPGELVNISEGQWRFDNSHPDLASFVSQFGLPFMGSCVNGFVKHLMPTNSKYSTLESQFLGVLDGNGQLIPENND